MPDEKRKARVTVGPASGLVAVRLGRGKAQTHRLVARGSRGGSAELRTLHASGDLAIAALPARSRLATVEVEVRSAGSDRLVASVPTAGAEIEGPVQVLLEAEETTLPLTLAIVACPYFVENGRVLPDPIMRWPDYYRAQVGTILTDLYSRPSPSPFAAPDVREGTQILSVFDPDQWSDDASDAPEIATLCAVSTTPQGRVIQASRRRCQAFAELYGIVADVFCVISGAPDAVPTGWFGTDNPVRGGVAFTYDGRSYLHAFHSALPGVVAFARKAILPYQARHELLHAMSSYNNGQLLDEYDLSKPYAEPGTDAPFAVNKRFVEDPSQFDGRMCEYNGTEYPGTLTRVQGWDLCVPTVSTPDRYCIMTTLYYDPVCDDLIAQFMLDRLRARVGREF